MAPPAKRRKKDAVTDADEENHEHPTNSLTKFLFSSPDPKGSPTASPSADRAQNIVSPSPIRTQTRLLSVAEDGGSPLGRLFSKSPSTSPEKGRSGKGQKRSRAAAEEKGKTADLVTLFSRQAQQRPRPVVAPGIGSSRNGPFSSTAPTAVDDILTDPMSDDDEVADHKATLASVVGQAARKRARTDRHNGHTTPAEPATHASSGQKFLRPPWPPHRASSDSPSDEERPWTERFAPTNLDELAVHKRKVADVRRWLDDVVAGRARQRLLVLKGAAGTGKTATVRLLARDMGLDVLEWKNPNGSGGSIVAGTGGYQSASTQFYDFVARGGRFAQLDVEDDVAQIPSPNSMPMPPPPQPDAGSRRILLVEEFPNTFMRSSSALTAFRGAILQYLSANVPSLNSFAQHQPKPPVTPIVMIISETLLSTSTASADSFTAHRLLGPEILRHPGTTIIEFNSIAPSLLVKALELVVLKEARRSGRRRTPGPLVLKKLSEIGDIRNAVASLEFLCLKGDQVADWGAKVAFTKPKRGAKDSVALTKGEEESLQLISQREASLGIFHAVGKVVYNKRDGPVHSESCPEARMPAHMSHLARPKRSQVCVDSLIDETGTDTITFVSALHENYALSCEPSGPSDMSSALDYINECIDYISVSDLLCPSWDTFSGGKNYFGPYGKDSGSHVLRQDEIAFQIAVRGLLFSLPHPVKRASGKGSDTFKMFYPRGLKLWRDKEELESILDSWSTRLLRGELNGAPNTSMTDGAMAFRRATKQDYGDSNGTAPRAVDHKRASEPTPLLSLGSAARKELLLDRLPYMALIGRGRKGSFNNVGLRDIEKITAFRGIGYGPAGEISDDDDVADNIVPVANENWATDRPTEDATPRKKRLAIRAKDEPPLSKVVAVQSLVLSDDDIED